MQLVFEGGSTGVFSQYQRIIFTQADIFGTDDLVGLLVLKHTILVDTALMSEGILSYDCLIRLGFDTRNSGNKPAGGVDLFGVDVGCEITEDIVSDLQRHDDLLKRGVPGTLTQTVDGTLDLSGTVDDRFKGVGHTEPKIVVIVYGDDGSAFDILAHLLDHRTDLKRQTEAYRIGKIDRGRTCFDDCIGDLFHEADIRSSCILAAELHILDESTCIGDGIDGALDHFIGFHLELMLHVDRTCGDESMNALVSGLGDRLSCCLDIPLQSSGK